MSSLDFRDIHQHPLSSQVIAPADPSWDTDRVYFSEFERTTNNDDNTLLFAMDDLDDEKKEASLEPVQQEGLDPLGWPLPPPELEEGDEADTESLVPNNDNEDLLPPAVHESLFESLGQRLEQALDLCGTPEATTTVVLTKEERLRQYETRQVDEESSVEPEEEPDEEEEEEVAVEYVQQQETQEEEDLPEDAVEVKAEETMDFADFGAVDVPTFQPSADAAATSTATTENTDSGKGLLQGLKVGLRGTTKKKKTEGPIPLIAPPPAEKLEKWTAKKH